MAFEVEKKVTVGTIINAVMMITVVVSGFVYMQSELKQMQDRVYVHEQFRNDVRDNYINRERLDYMVNDRIERLEMNIEERFDRLDQKLDRAAQTRTD